jgi:hypothetical protein
MTIRFRAHPAVLADGAWQQREMPERELTDWHQRWRHDFAIDVRVLGHWMPAHDYLAASVVWAALNRATSTGK